MDQNIYELIRKKLDKTITVEETFELLSSFTEIFLVSSPEDEENEIEKIIYAFEAIGYNDHKEVFFDNDTFFLINQLAHTIENTYEYTSRMIDKKCAKTFERVYHQIALIHILKKDGITYTACKEDPFTNLDLSQCDNPKYVYQNHELISHFIDKVLSGSTDIDEEPQERKQQEQKDSVTNHANVHTKERNTLTNILYPKDRINGTTKGIWNQNTELAQSIGNGEMFPVKVGEKKGQQITALLGVNFPPQIEKRLTPTDKTVFFMVANLQYIGNTYTTFNELGYYVFGIKNISKRQKEILKESIIKLIGTTIILDNYDEYKNFRNRVHIQYTGNLLNASITTIEQGKRKIEIINFNPTMINGIEYREPALFLFGKLRNQMCTFKLQTLMLPFKQTERVRLIVQYLLENIFISKNYKDGKTYIYLGNLLGTIGVYRSNYATSKSYRNEIKSIEQNMLDILNHFKNTGAIESFSNFIKTGDKITEKKVVVYYKGAQ